MPRKGFEPKFRNDDDLLCLIERLSSRTRSCGELDLLDLESYRTCAMAYSKLGFDDLAIGGLVPRVGDLEGVLKIVEAVRSAVLEKPLHVFGIGKPGAVKASEVSSRSTPARM
jgi:hypothetical protein